MRRRQLPLLTLPTGILLLITAGPPARADAIPGPYVSFAYSGNITTGPLSSGSYTYSNTHTTQFGTASVNAALETDASSSTWGVMTLFDQAVEGTSPNLQILIDMEAGDTITPQSGTLAQGTLVPFLFTFQLHYSLSDSGPYAVPADLDFGGGGVFVGSQWSTDCNNYGGADAGCVPASMLWTIDNGPGGGTLTVTDAVNLAVGQTSDFVEQLWSDNQVSSLPGATGAFDAASTAWLNIASENPNVTFTTGSGYMYSGDPEAPEPGTLLLFGAGIAGISTLARRTRQ